MSSGKDDLNQYNNRERTEEAPPRRRQYLRNPIYMANQRARLENDSQAQAELDQVFRLAEWLQAKLDASGRSVRDVAKDIGVAHVTLRSWLLGHNLPSSDAARKLARYYKVDEDWLLEMSGHRTSRNVATTDPERQEFLMWANANVDKIPVKQLRALRRMMEELAAEG